MHRTTVWSVVFLTGSAFAASVRDVDSTVGASFASATAKATLTPEATSWKEPPAAATIWIQIGSQQGSAVISLFDRTTPLLHTTEDPISPSAVHDATHRKTVGIASCDASFDFTMAASAAAPASTGTETAATETHRFANSTGDGFANQPRFDNSTVDMTAAPFNPSMFNATTLNTTTLNTTTFNATTLNTTSSNATSNLPFRGPFPTQLPTSISLFSSRAVSTQNSASQLVVALLLQVAFTLL